MITQELVKSFFDYKDGVLYWKINRTKLAKAGTKAGSILKGEQTRYKVSINSKYYYLHRIIFLYHHGYLPKYIDHINGDSTDNRIENLRAATQSQNTSNAKLFNTNTSGIKGVSWDKRNNKWTVGIGLDYKRIHLGRYDTLEEAKTVIEKKRKELHKEFARNE